MVMPRKKNKTPPVMSHEFVIQNHADIVACFAIVIVMGLVSDATAKISKLFIFLQYGVKNNETESDVEEFPVEFERGMFDIFMIVFAGLLIIVIHAVIQEYGIDKVTKKLHLSKTKNSKFSESGQLAAWCLFSAGWGMHIIYKTQFIPNIEILWEGYPHTIIQWETKLFMISQIAYWLHMYPELYFQKARREEIPSRVQYYSLHLAFIVGAYALHLWKVAIVLLSLHYLAEGLFYACRLLACANKTQYSKSGFAIWKVLYPFVRLVILALSFLVFWLGLGKEAENNGFDISTGNYNSFLIRMTCLSSLVLLQVWQMWLFIQLQLRRSKEEAQLRKKEKAAQAIKPKNTKKSQKKADADSVGNGTHAKSGNKLKKN